MIFIAKFFMSLEVEADNRFEAEEKAKAEFEKHYKEVDINITEV